MTEKDNNETTTNTDDGATKQWYTLQIASNSEETAKTILEQKIADLSADNSPLKDLFGEVLLPKEFVVTTRNGKKGKKENKLYPGYLFIEMVMTDEALHLVKSVQKVSNFMGGGKPVVIPAAEIAKIKNQVTSSEAMPRQTANFEIGKPVRVIDGPFKDLTGEVAEVDADNQRLKVNVSIFGRSTPVELSFQQVDKVDT